MRGQSQTEGGDNPRVDNPERLLLFKAPRSEDLEQNTGMIHKSQVFRALCGDNPEQNAKSRIGETLNLSTCTDSSTDTKTDRNGQKVKSKNNKYHMYGIRCHLSPVACHLSPNTCHLLLMPNAKSKLGYTVKYSLSPQEFPRPLPSRFCSCSGYISSYIPPLVIIQMQCIKLVYL